MNVAIPPTSTHVIGLYLHRRDINEVARLLNIPAAFAWSFITQTYQTNRPFRSEVDNPTPQGPWYLATGL